MPPLLNTTYRWARRICIAVLGGTVVLIGVLMIVFPGPAVVVIPAGLAILGLEFAFARRWLRKVKATGQSASRWLFGWRRRQGFHTEIMTNGNPRGTEHTKNS